jgi:hypothetical protein
MTLADMASFICGKLGKTDSDSLAKCKEFLARRYELIWSSQLWRDTLTTASQSVPADTQDVTLTDSSIDQIVAVRWSDTTLGPVAHEAVFAIDPTLFDGSGTPMAFVTLPKTTDGACRIRLVQKPKETKTITVLGKQKIRIIDSDSQFQTRNLTLDGDKPAIYSIDNALISFAEADMLARDRQYGKSQLMMQDGVAQVKVATNVEQSQAANNLQLNVVDSGEWSRDDWDSATGDGYRPNFLGLG